MDDYQYKVLPSTNHIRVLTILPSADKDARIECTISADELNQDANYNALSYTWAMNDTGDASKCRAIYVSGAVLPITRNLFEGLKRIRHATDSLRFWIDAVCINQQDILERNSQVAMMPQIYGSAAGVVVWLGEGVSEQMDEDAALLMSVFGGVTWNLWFGWHHKGPEPAEEHSIEKRLCSTTEGSDRLRDALRAGLDPENRVEGMHRSLIPKDRDTWLHITTIAEVALCLLKRKYFTRRWIIQELYHAHPNGVTVRWGSSIVDGESFRAGFKAVGLFVGPIQTHLPDVHGGKESGHPRLESLRKSIGQLKKHFPFPDKNASDFSSLISVLSKYSHMECKDDRDRLNSLLSMANETDLITDYSKSTIETYISFSDWLIRSGCLDVLLVNLLDSQRNRCQRPRGLPSWAIDLRTEFSDSRSLSHYDLPCSPRVVGEALHCELVYLGAVKSKWVEDGNAYIRIGLPSGVSHPGVLGSLWGHARIQVNDLVYSTSRHLPPRVNDQFGGIAFILFYMRRLFSSGKEYFTILRIECLSSHGERNPWQLDRFFVDSTEIPCRFEDVTIV